MLGAESDEEKDRRKRGADTNRQAQIQHKVTHAPDLLFNIVLGLFPITTFLGLFEPHCRSVLGRARRGICEYDMRVVNVLNEMLWTDDVAYSPSSGIECLANRTYGESVICDG